MSVTEGLIPCNPGTPEESADPEFSLEKAAHKGTTYDDSKQQVDGEQVFAAEYNPDEDLLDERKRRGQAEDKDEMEVDEEEVEEDVEEDDVDDMFAAIMEKPAKKVRIG